MMARTLGKLLLLALSSLLVLGLGEIFLRSVVKPDSVSTGKGEVKPRFNVYTASSALAYKLRPNWSARHASSAGEFSVLVRTNALGLRGRAATIAKEPGIYRIFTLGDSFTFGFGVEDDETLPSQLETELGGPNAGVEVLNGGVPGWATDQYLIRTRTFGLELDPDLVLVVITENDAEDMSWHRLEVDTERLPVRIHSTRRMIDRYGQMRYVNDTRIPVPQVSFPGHNWLLDHSRVYGWLRYRIARAWIITALRAGARARNIDKGEGPPGPIAELTAEQIQRGLDTSSGFRLRYHYFLLDHVERMAAERGIPVRYVTYIGMNLAPEPGSSESRLRAHCDTQPSRCLNTERLFTPDNIQQFYFAEDRHPNAAGHAHVAAALADWLRADAELGLPAGD